MNKKDANLIQLSSFASTSRIKKILKNKKLFMVAKIDLDLDFEFKF